METHMHRFLYKYIPKVNGAHWLIELCPRNLASWESRPLEFQFETIIWKPLISFHRDPFTKHAHERCFTDRNPVTWSASLTALPTWSTNTVRLEKVLHLGPHGTSHFSQAPTTLFACFLPPSFPPSFPSSNKHKSYKSSPKRNLTILLTIFLYQPSIHWSLFNFSFACHFFINIILPAR